MVTCEVKNFNANSNSSVKKSSIQYFRGSILHFIETLDGRNRAEKPPLYEYFEDGILEVKGGRVAFVGPFKDFSNRIDSNAPVAHYQSGLILPGFVDAHMHLANIDSVASPCNELFSWLNDYVF